MKILCPTDFSMVSINAIQWAIYYLESRGGGEIEILNCLDIRSRGDVFLNIEALIREPSEEDMKLLMDNLNVDKELVKLSSNISNANAKSFIPARARKISADMIVLGTTGLTNLKNITIGSVTEYIIKHSDIPVLAIPKHSKFKNFDKIVLGADKELLKKPELLDGIKRFIGEKKTHINIVQVYKDEEEYLRIDDELIGAFDQYDVEIKPIPFNESISESLNEYADEVNAQIISIIHHKKNWFSSLFHHSILKEGLFNQDLPVLVVSD